MYYDYYLAAGGASCAGVLIAPLYILSGEKKNSKLSLKQGTSVHNLNHTYICLAICSGSWELAGWLPINERQTEQLYI